MLELLLAAQGRVVSAEELLERVWDEMADPFTSAVKVTMSRLRRKLGEPAGHRDRGPGRLPDLTHGALPRAPPRRLARLPRRIVRLRLTALYGGLFLLSGAGCSRSPTCSSRSGCRWSASAEPRWARAAGIGSICAANPNGVAPAPLNRLLVAAAAP